MKVELRGVHKYFEARSGPVKILENVNLVVPHGDFVSIMGPSGSGKTTLLNMIGCIDNPSYGKVLLDDRDTSVANESIREQVRLRHVGFIFQSYNLLPTLTVLENVLLPMQLSEQVRSRKEEIDQAMALLRIVGLDARAKDSVLKLSGGQQQRVAIARALSNLPGLILADEPTGNLDERSSKEVLDVFRTINENQRITTIMVTHDSKAASFAKRVLYLEGGHLAQHHAI
ncbi:ABC transporter ATP-binding protein [bacterium]|nr:ABC transporter ATP-binding protein [bacterium]